MAITASSTVFAILMIVLSIFAMVRDKNYYEWEEPGPAYNRWENEDFAGRHHSITRSVSIDNDTCFQLFLKIDWFFNSAIRQGLGWFIYFFDCFLT